MSKPTSPAPTPTSRTPPPSTLLEPTTPTAATASLYFEEADLSHRAGDPASSLPATTAQTSGSSSQTPPTPPEMTVPRLKTPPPGARKSPISHRRNRHAPVTAMSFGPMVSTPHGVMLLSPLAAQPISPSPLAARRRIGRLGAIGESAEEWEMGEEAKMGKAEEVQKEDAESKEIGKKVSRKLRFWDETEEAHSEEKESKDS